MPLQIIGKIDNNEIEDLNKVKLLKIARAHCKAVSSLEGRFHQKEKGHLLH